MKHRIELHLTGIALELVLRSSSGGAMIGLEAGSARRLVGAGTGVVSDSEHPRADEATHKL
ncbi:MAG: hypothetical protein ACP5HS_13295 [Anaerolineae bacterium]